MDEQHNLTDVKYYVVLKIILTITYHNIYWPNFLNLRKLTNNFI